MHDLRNRAWRWSAACLILCAGALVGAEDWPEWRGKGRLGVWNETGLVEKFPEGGPPVAWRTPIHAGYSGPSVADGRVFVTDARSVRGTHMIERIVALDERSGKILWTREWEADYSGLELTFAVGPRATPTVDGDRVYVLGTVGNLLALDVKDGRVLWQKDAVKDLGADVPSWGMSAAPLVDGDRLITLIGGAPDGKVMAFNKLTGAEMWRALSSDWETGYNQPIIIEAGEARQLLIWHPLAINSLNPETGKVYWEFPYRALMGMTVPTMVQSGSNLLAVYSNGARMLNLDASKPASTLVWGTDTNFTPQITIGTPVIQGDYIYGMMAGQFQCWELATGKSVWKTREMMEGRTISQNTVFMVRNGDRYFILTDRGDLIIARLAPTGYEEVSRAVGLIEPTHPYAREPEGAVQWSHPAYANKHILVRNNKEILSASLAKE